MYTAKIKNKEIQNGVIKVEVEFTDGTQSLTETCVPQNEDGLTFWVKSRLETFNSAIEIDNKYKTGEKVDIPTPVTPELTPSEIARNQWLTQYNLWVKVKTTLIDTDILSGTETKVTLLKDKVKNDFKPEYLEYIV